MPLITLTSDWGLRDQHVAVLKGLLLRHSSDNVIVDISHDIQHFNIAQAAYVFRSAYTSFPEGTVHFIGVGSFSSPGQEIIAVKKEGHAFLGMNDGFFSLLFDDKPVDMVVIENNDNNHAAYNLPLIASTVNNLASGKNIYELGNRPEEFIMKNDFRPVIEEDVIRGTIIYIDDFGNAVTNIHRDLFEQQRANRKFEINARRQQYTITVLSDQYSEVPRGNMVALFNTAGLLEIAINQGHASNLLGLKNNDTIRIDFL